jgi:hypothetical protein
MPKREDETWLNIHPHPPACTCTVCVKKKLGASKDEAYSRYGTPATECPVCERQSLIYNNREAKYQCLNDKCNISGETLTEIRKIKKT